MADNLIDNILVEAMISCAHKLKIAACVEGVETQQLFDAARACAADYYQGYLIAKPLDFLDLQAFVNEHNKKFS